MRRVHVRAAGKVSATSEMPAASAVASATSVLCQGNRSLQAGTGHDTGSNQHNFS